MTGEAFGPYLLTSLLGRGGMGEVWRAVDTSHGGRVVAVKVLGPWLNGDEEFAERFRRESALAASLSGPHIVPIHRYGAIDGRLFIDMPLIEGTDLAALLDEHGPLPPARAVAIVDQVADALDTAHRAGMVHRDVKPSNVLVTARASRDHAYLIDFGIARAVDGTRYSMSGAVIGTMAYMAPERFDGLGDHRSDVYALGCVLLEALTGRPPYAVAGMPAYWRAHSSAPRPRPSALRPGVPPGLDHVVATAMDPDPGRRYARVADLATAAQAAQAAPVGPGTRAVVTSVVPRRGDVTVPPPPWAQRNPGLPQDPWHRPGPMPSSTPFPPAAGPGTPDRTRWRRRSWPVAAVAGIALLTVLVALVLVLPRGPAAPAPSAGQVGAVSITEGVLTGHANNVRGVATTQLDGRTVIISGSADNTARVWDLATGNPVGDPLTGHTAGVIGVTTTQLDGRTVIISGGSDQTLRVWDLATGDPIGDPLTGHTAGVRALTITQLDGRTVIVSGSNDNSIRIWDLATGNPIGDPLTSHTNTVTAVTTAPLRGRTVIVSGSTDRTLRVWDLATGDPIGDPFIGHSSGIFAVTITQLDGRPVIVSTGFDETLRTWDLIARTGG